MLLPSPIRPFYPISRPLKTLQQNPGGLNPAAAPLISRKICSDKRSHSDHAPGWCANPLKNDFATSVTVGSTPPSTVPHNIEPGIGIARSRQRPHDIAPTYVAIRLWSLAMLEA
jgi:hypothetical protein